MIALLLLLPLLADAAIRRVPASIIRPAGYRAPGTILAPDGGDLRDRPAIIMPEGISREIVDSEGAPLRERKDIVVPDQAALDKAVAGSAIKAPPIVVDQKKVLDETIAAQAKPTAFEQLKAQAKKAGTIPADYDPPEFLAAKTWPKKARHDVEDKLALAAKMEPAERSAAIRALFLKYGDHLDWTGGVELMKRLPDHPSAAAVRDLMIDAFLSERAASMTERERAVAASMRSASKPNKA